MSDADLCVCGCPRSEHHPVYVEGVLKGQRCGRHTWHKFLLGRQEGLDLGAAGQETCPSCGFVGLVAGACPRCGRGTHVVSGPRGRRRRGGRR